MNFGDKKDRCFFTSYLYKESDKGFLKGPSKPCYGTLGYFVHCYSDEYPSFNSMKNYILAREEKSRVATKDIYFISHNEITKEHADRLLSW